MIKTIDISNLGLTRDELVAWLDSHTEIILVDGTMPLAKLTRHHGTTSITHERTPNLHHRTWLRADFDHVLPKEFWADKL